MKGKRNYYYRKRKNKKINPLIGGFALILFALVLLVGSRISSGDSAADKSFGAYIPNTAVNYESGRKMISQQDVPPGTLIDSYMGVPVYSNGKDYMSSHGLNFSSDGYYYGYKWQCVEFVKRFYYIVYNHSMPDGAGNAKYFFNPMLAQGEFNEQRGLFQYHNGGDVKPQPGDILVFSEGKYGHVAIISATGQGWVEVIQQNSEYPRERFELQIKKDSYTVIGKEKNPAGWLRK